MHVKVIRKDSLFSPDPSRIIPRFLNTTESRSIEIVKSVLAMPETEVINTISPLLRDFSTRHRNITRIFEKHVGKLAPIFNLLEIDINELSLSRRALIGSCFTMEYSIESAAFYNPSLMEDPDQSEIRPDEKRVIFSFRATGEGHISSIVFRSGVLDRDNNLTLEPVGKMLAEAEVINQSIYNKRIFLEKLGEIGDQENIISLGSIMDKLGDSFTYDELMQCLNEAKQSLPSSSELLINQMMWLASTHYEIDFSIDSALSERVIFPISSTEKNGIEDARFVKFTDDDGAVTYYATLTAHDGVSIMPKLIKTTDFYHFKVLPMYGEIVGNKGMALFPRKINGKYAMLCRIDGVNNFIAYSDTINVWHEAKLIQEPKYPWELLQIGNAGSPIETEDGWLVITFAIGPMKKCVISASLFELDNPEKEIGRLKTPLIMPNESEREGYVPNVIFSCGSIIHNEDLIIPYAMSDHTSTFASVNLKELLNELKDTESTSRKPVVSTIERKVNLDNESKMKVA
jgi:beta-1,2-mannobiose phosphorylase / 1,2-beta-oligomannan phosphorylase